MAKYYLLDGDEYKEVSLDDLLKAEKLVKESDLLTIKGSSETATKKFQEEIDSLKKKNEEFLGRATTAESASEEVNKKYEEAKVKAEAASKLETELNELKTKHSAAETQLLTTRRNSLIEKYQLKDEAKTKVESMTAEQLTSAEEAASLFGNQPAQKSSRQFDRNSNSTHNDNWDDSSGIDDLKAGLKDIRRVGAGAAE